jgi:hypothetical protein
MLGADRAADLAIDLQHAAILDVAKNDEIRADDGDALIL